MRTAFCRPFNRDEVSVVLGALIVGWGLVAASTLLPRLWGGTQAQVTGDSLRFFANGSAIFAAILLPTWASRWRAAAIVILAVGVLALITELTNPSPAGPALERILRLMGLLLAISTIWVATRFWQTLGRLWWLALVFWTLGLPLLGFLSHDAGGS